MNLSARLEKLKNLMLPGEALLDVGCDHAWLSIAAVRDGVCTRAVASDLRKAPLAAAARHVEEEGLSGRVELLLSDGLSEVREPFGVLCIAGMGGQLICDILTGVRRDGAERPEERERAARLVLSARQLLLSPQSEPELVRRLLTEGHGIPILGEYWAEDAGKFYLVLDARPGERGKKAAEPPYSKAELLFGRKEHRHDEAVFIKAMEQRAAFLGTALEKAKKAGSPEARERVRELSEELMLLREAVSEQEGGSNGNYSPGHRADG